jgi:uncharacterized membrane protein YphA (DoxX/SURF4 family)
MLDTIQRTGDRTWPIIPRLIAGVPLALFGLLHLVGADPVEPVAAAAGLPMPGLVGVAAPAVEFIGGLMLVFGWITRVGGVLGAVVMVGAIVVHFIIPNDRWPQPASGTLGPEPLLPFLLAWAVLGCCIIAVIRGGGRWSVDRRQLAGRASSRGGGLDGPVAPRVKPPKRKKGETVKEGESVW